MKVLFVVLMVRYECGLSFGTFLSKSAASVFQVDVGPQHKYIKTHISRML